MNSEIKCPINKKQPRNYLRFSQHRLRAQKAILCGVFRRCWCFHQQGMRT